MRIIIRLPINTTTHIDGEQIWLRVHWTTQVIIPTEDDTATDVVTADVSTSATSGDGAVVLPPHKRVIQPVSSVTLLHRFVSVCLQHLQ